MGNRQTQYQLPPLETFQPELAEGPPVKKACRQSAWFGGISDAASVPAGLVRQYIGTVLAEQAPPRQIQCWCVWPKK